MQWWQGEPMPTFTYEELFKREKGEPLQPLHLQHSLTGRLNAIFARGSFFASPFWLFSRPLSHVPLINPLPETRERLRLVPRQLRLSQNLWDTLQNPLTVRIYGHSRSAQYLLHLFDLTHRVLNILSQQIFLLCVRLLLVDLCHGFELCER